MSKKRTETFNLSQVCNIGKVSFRLSKTIVLSGLKQGSWLDLMCGYNSDLQQSYIHSKQNLVSSYFALDQKINKRLVNLGINCKEIAIDKKLPYPKNCFDNVTLINALEHLWNPQIILNECFRITKVNGAIQIIVPTWFGKTILEYLAFTRKGAQEIIEMDDHKMYYDEKTIWPMLVKAGFLPHNIKINRVKFFCSLYIRAVKD